MRTHLNSGLLYHRVHFPTGLVFWNSHLSFEAAEWHSASVHETCAFFSSTTSLRSFMILESVMLAVIDDSLPTLAGRMVIYQPSRLPVKAADSSFRVFSSQYVVISSFCHGFSRIRPDEWNPILLPSILHLYWRSCSQIAGDGDVVRAKPDRRALGHVISLGTPPHLHQKNPLEVT